MAHSSFNSPIGFHSDWLSNININLRALEDAALFHTTTGQVTGLNRIKWAFGALGLTDLTTLSGDDTESNVHRMCLRAAYPFPRHTLKFLDDEAYDSINTAAVCVYPSRVADAANALKGIDKGQRIQIAAVATGFPSGQFKLESRLIEIKNAIDDGATEIDVVIDRSLVLTDRWQQLYDELVSMRTVCAERAHMKTILAIGECGSVENVYKASLVAMMAGSDFIKTSTGKEAVNAIPPIGLLMIRAIREFRQKTGKKIGLKPAGGVKTVDDAIKWMTMVKNTLGDEWLQSDLFRFGASGLLDDIEKEIFTFVKQFEL